MSNCQTCGEPLVFDKQVRQKKFCSRRCAGIAARAYKPSLKCGFCGTTFKQSHSMAVHVNTYCSKSCAGKAAKRSWTAEDLVENIDRLIIQNDRYTSRTEIMRRLKVSSKTLSSFKVSVLELNNNLGFYNKSSVFENEVYIALTTVFEKVVRQKSFKDCLSPKGSPLRFDFFLPCIGTLVEADGLQHKVDGSFFNCELTQLHDVIKNEYCESRGIRLVRIPYSRHVNTQDVISCVTP